MTDCTVLNGNQMQVPTAGRKMRDILDEDNADAIEAR